MNSRCAVEKDWTTACGHRAVVIYIGAMGYRCGYVLVPAEHPLCGVQHYRMSIYAHGGLTYGKHSDEYPVETKGEYWIGFHCAHLGDRTHIIPGVERTLEFCVKQCESISTQLS